MVIITYVLKGHRHKMQVDEINEKTAIDNLKRVGATIVRTKDEAELWYDDRDEYRQYAA